MRKLLIVVSFLMVASMLLSACGTPRRPPPRRLPPRYCCPATAAPATSAPATAAPTSAPNPYVGSGKLDGNGIPPDFFADVNIRKGFSYAFDWDTYINDVYKGEAVQSLEIPLPGMPGYDANAPHYTLDLDKATAAFKASTLKSADGKSVWDVGFRLQMLYNQGNPEPPDRGRNSGRQPGPDQPEIQCRDPRPALAGLPGRPARQPDPDHDRRLAGRYP